MMEWMFFLFLFINVYNFIGYPVCLMIIGLIKRDKSINLDEEGFTPFVSIVLSVYNEKDVIEKKIDNFLDLDYPEDFLELIIVSDGSTDNTENLVKSFNSERIKLLVQERRSGKTMALNRGVKIARGEIVAFTDANSMFDRCAIRKIVRRFKDPLIGLVTGMIIYFEFDGKKREAISGSYQRYEEMLKRNESKIASVVGADGAIYAIRRELYEPLRPEYINDFTHPIQVVLKGYRAVLDSEAICREEVESSDAGEYKRQIRMISQAFFVYIAYIVKLIINKKWLYAWELTSHKAMRWLTLIWMAGLFLTNIMLLNAGLLFQSFFIIQIIFFFVTILSAFSNIKILNFLYQFVLVHFAAIMGIYSFLHGKTFVTWEPRKD